MEHKTLTADTLKYYEKHADEFISSTIYADVRGLYEKFEKYLSAGNRILDLGCGSGRDSKYFAEKGYQVTAVDPSPEMCKSTRDYAGVRVQIGTAEELLFDQDFDGVWACASLLHVPREKQVTAMNAICNSMVHGGILYCSWKYGDQDRNDQGRLFTDLNEHGLKMILQEVPESSLIETWITTDVRPEKAEQKWLNALIRKK